MNKKYLLLLETAFSNSFDKVFASSDLKEVVRYYYKNCKEDVEHDYMIVELLINQNMFVLYD